MSDGRAPVERVLEFALFAPVGAAIALTKSVPVFMRAGRRGAGHLVAAMSVHESVTPVPELSDQAAGEAVTVAPETGDGPAALGDEAEVPPTAEILPIDDYDHLAARQVVDRLGALSETDRDLIEAYELTHRHRRTILGKIEQLRA